MRYHRRHPGHRLGHVDDHVNNAIRADRWARYHRLGARRRERQWQSRRQRGPEGARQRHGDRHLEGERWPRARGQDVPLPWEHSIDVVEEAPSEVRADGAGASGCTITMGDMLVSFKNEPNPVCEFAYWG